MEKKNSPYNSMENNKKNAVSPLDKGEINNGTNNIRVKILDWPDEKRMKVLLTKMVKATIGGDVDEVIDDNSLGEELFLGGLQTGLEAFNVSFEISGVSRAFTHQFVRTRKAAYHQQSSRFTYMGDMFNVRMPQSIADDSTAKKIFELFVESSRLTYRKLCELNIPFQDARFAVPVGIETYIIGEFPLKVFLDTYAYRGCYGFQWEIVHVFQEMRRQLIEKLPFLEPYIKISCEKVGRCTFQGWENVEDFCPLPYAKDRIFKSKYFTSDNVELTDHEKAENEAKEMYEEK